MIYVDELQPNRTPWMGGQSCHLLSDCSVGELLDFGRSIGLPLSWFQAVRAHPHFDLSPRWRARAIAAGARPVGRREFVAAMHRYRVANPL